MDNLVGFRHCLAVVMVLGLPWTAAAQRQCEALQNLSLQNGRVVAVSVVAPGTFRQPTDVPVTLAGQRGYADLARFCRVTLALTPTSDSNIRVEVWLPEGEWNGKFIGVGNGGWAGFINYGAMADELRRGYAVAATDTGHTGTTRDGSFAEGHPEKVVDFGYRAVHEMTVSAKAVVAARFGRLSSFNYWNGCSTGGKQGLMEAQRYPGDYDGIVAGAPANYLTHLHGWSLWFGQVSNRSPEAVLSPGDHALLHASTVRACDKSDGVVDGLIADPTRCSFDPKSLVCEGPNCLSAAKAETAARIYRGIPDADGRSGFPGLEPGSELGWSVLGGPEPFSMALHTFRHIVFKNPTWDARQLDVDRDLAIAERVDGGTNNAIDPQLKPFFDRGGKLLLYHGWSDDRIPPRNTLSYYQQVLKATGGTSADSVRLFMAPGMAHCPGVGDGPNEFDAVSALEAWVERRVPPDAIVASQSLEGKGGRTRPLCPWPQVATYVGIGSIDDARSFVCRAP